MLYFLCPHCRQPMEAEDDRVGQAVFCPGCLRALSVPRLGPPTPAAPPPKPAPVVQPIYESPKALRLSDLPREIVVPPSPARDRHRHVPSPPRVWLLAVTWLIAGILAQAGVTLGTGPGSALKEFSHRTPLFYMAVLLGSLLVLGVIALVLSTAIAAFMKRRERPLVIRLQWVFCIVAPTLGALLLGTGMFWHEHGYPWLQTAAKDDASLAKAPALWVPDPVRPGHVKPLVPGSEPTPAAPAADLKRMSDFNHAFLADMEDTQKEYTDALAKAGVRRIMDPTRIAQDRDSSETRALLAASRTALQNLRSRVAHLLAEHPARLEALHLAPANLKAALQGIHDGDADFLPVANELWDAEAALMDRVEQMIQFLQEKRADWSVGERGRFKFKNEADSKRYDELVADAQKITARQAALREQLKAVARDQKKSAPVPAAP